MVYTITSISPQNIDTSHCTNTHIRKPNTKSQKIQ